MTEQRHLRSATIDALTVLLNGNLTGRAEARCIALIDKLNAPVRIGIFGLPGSGKRKALEALTGLTMNLPPQVCPTIQVEHGPHPATKAILADGSQRQIEEFPTTSLLRQSPVFLQITSPDAALRGRLVLLIATSANSADLQAGFAWAAPRVDLAIWCAANWTAGEASLWHHAPDSLHNHAVLLTSGDSKSHDIGLDGFGAQIGLNDGDQTDAYAGLNTYLDQIIAEANLHDIHAAQMFLQRYTPATDDPTISARSVIQPSVPVPAPRQSPPEAHAELARLFQTVRTSADSLRVCFGDVQTLQHDPLETFEQVFEELADRVAGSEPLQEAWPDLAAQVTEAHDMALLLRVEGGTEQLRDAARLLLQVRYDIQERLAA